MEYYFKGLKTHKLIETNFYLNLFKILRIRLMNDNHYHNVPVLFCKLLVVSEKRDLNSLFNKEPPGKCVELIFSNWSLQCSESNIMLSYFFKI